MPETSKYHWPCVLKGDMLPSRDEQASKHQLVGADPSVFRGRPPSAGEAATGPNRSHRGSGVGMFARKSTATRETWRHIRCFVKTPEMLARLAVPSQRQIAQEHCREAERS